jgi:tRNA A37 threonylcarbamoyladenosine synthetase subunit TsaC/SUA5/YrdC
VGLRCSSDPWAAALLARFGAPVTSTSANRSGEDPARDAMEARAAFPSGVFVLDGGPRRGSAVSTVVEFAGGRATVLRAGAIGAEEIAAFIQQSE